MPSFAVWPAALRRPDSAGHAGAAANVKLTFQSATQRGLITACQDARGCFDAQGDPRAGKLVELPTRRWLMLCWH